MNHKMAVQRPVRVGDLPWLAGVDAGGVAVDGDRISVSGWLVSPTGPEGSRVLVGGQTAEVRWEHATEPVAGLPSDWPVWSWLATSALDQPVSVEATVMAPDGAVIAQQLVWPDNSYRVPVPVGQIDFPAKDAEVDGDLAVVSGWLLLDDELPARIEVDVDGAAPHRARLMLPRPDVTRELPELRQGGLSGYEARVPVSVAPGTRQRVALRVRAWSRNGRQWCSPTQYVTLHSRAARERDVDADRRCTEFTEQLLARIKTEVDTDHVMIVTHSLRVGGGQFWLSELIRHLVGTHGHRVTLVSPEDGPLRADLETMGVTVHVTGHHRVQDAVTYGGYVTELALLAATSGAGVVLVNTLGMFVGVDAAKRAGLPVAWVIHESFALADFAYLNWGMGQLDPVVRVRWEQTLADADTLLFVADATRELFMPWSRPSRCLTVRYGIDLVPVRKMLRATTKEEVRRELGLPDTARILLNIGVSEPRKGHGPLLVAFERLLATHQDAHLVIVGMYESPYCDALRDYAEQTGFADSVTLVPICADPSKWLRAADLFVNSSDIESLPRSILEAIAYRLPVVAADVFGTREVISDGETGWLFVPNDVNALTVGLLRAIDTPADQREAIAARALTGVGSFLDSKHYGEEFSTILTCLARGTGTGEEQRT